MFCLESEEEEKARSNSSIVAILCEVFESSVLSSERKDQIGGEKEQSTCHREVLQSSTMSPNDPKHEDAEG
ncbi:hypothetical protein MTR67_011841 [Solanum verrucosum]|uniref:Uncharacterized protein n=1 Tax=Solanum verrucosum TaxID=315347 RepID=A0AAF0TGG9_SOLVR|nr:hypothetical protein MTR67_011841 [Solanum verrucosum]